MKKECRVAELVVLFDSLQRKFRNGLRSIRLQFRLISHEKELSA